jgi:predicted nuclease with TOPRIM domain
VPGSNYISRQEIDEKLAADEAYLGELLERQRELRAELHPIIEELKAVSAEVAAVEQAVADWSKRKPG